VLRRPDSRDEFEPALGTAMTALQLGNCDLVRLRGTSDGGGGGTLWPGTRALAIRTREAYGAERYNEVRKARRTRHERCATNLAFECVCEAL
jgi:hypothetical protein